jgi:hypothetical protein
LTQDAVRRSLAEKEKAELIAGDAFVMHEDISASELITMGMDLEEQQYVYRQYKLRLFTKNLHSRQHLRTDYAALGQHSTDAQNTKLQVRSNTLRRKINAWTEVQQLYIPGVRVLRVRAERDRPDGEEPERTESMPLWLPSAIGKKTVCDRRLREMEWGLRHAQANDALNELRNGLRLRSYLYIDKDRFQRGQRRNTRSRTIIQRADVKVQSSATKYRVARSALMSLARTLNKVGWDTSLPHLADKDVRGISVGLEGETEGRRTLSWIWTRLGVAVQATGDHHLHDGVCSLIFKEFRSLKQDISQQFGLSGVRQGLGHCVGRKKYNSFKKRCDAFSNSSPRRHNGGRNRACENGPWHHDPVTVQLHWKAAWLMLTSRLHYVVPSTTTSRICGGTWRST